MGSIGRGATPVPCLLVLHVCSACEVLQAVQQHLMDGWQAGRALTTPQKGAWGRHPESPRLPRACGAQASWRMRPLRQPRPWLPKRLPAARPWPRSAPGRNRLERVRRGGGGEVRTRALAPARRSPRQRWPPPPAPAPGPGGRCQTRGPAARGGRGGGGSEGRASSSAAAGSWRARPSALASSLAWLVNTACMFSLPSVRVQRSLPLSSSVGGPAT